MKPECPKRQAQNDATTGVLRLTLSSSSYEWQFISVGGKVLGSGSESVS